MSSKFVKNTKLQKIFGRPEYKHFLPERGNLLRHTDNGWRHQELLWVREEEKESGEVPIFVKPKLPSFDFYEWFIVTDVYSDEHGRCKFKIMTSTGMHWSKWIDINKLPNFFEIQK